MVNSIPASDIVSVSPQVLSASGSGLNMSGLILTDSIRVPIGSVYSFANASDVSDYFGAASKEYAMAQTYFTGFLNSTIKPAEILFYQWAVDAVPAYLRSASLETMTLAQLKTLSGTLILTVNGEELTSSSISFSSATSFSSAAALIQAAFGHYDAVVTGAISGTTLTVSSVSSGALAVGQIIEGSGITPGTYITALGSGTGAEGTYTVSVSQAVSSGTISAGEFAVTFDSVASAFVFFGGTPGDSGTLSYATGTLATSLSLTEATAAVLSQGSDAVAPGDVMPAVTDITQNFVSYGTTFIADAPQALGIAQWNNAQNGAYRYVLLDTNIAATTNNPSVSPGYQVSQAGYAGVKIIYAPSDKNQVGAELSYPACLDFTEAGGRTTAKFRQYPGLTADVTNQTIASRLRTNGFNFYGAWASRGNGFTFSDQGKITGEFVWDDAYVNQIWMNDSFQVNLIDLLLSAKSVPYNSTGYALIEAAMMDTVNAALNFGAIQPGVTLSEAQAAQVNAAAGFNISDTIQDRGWYILVQDAAPSVRAARGSPPVKFFYTDGGSVHTINLASVEVQ